MTVALHALNLMLRPMFTYENCLAIKEKKKVIIKTLQDINLFEK